MFMFRGKRSGNRYTLLSIVMILLMLYGISRISPRKEVVFPQSVQYKGYWYEYAETVKKTPLQFVRKRPASEEGFIILALRKGSSEAVLKEIYLYQGFMLYRRYVLRPE